MESLPETALLVGIVERGLKDIIGDGRVPGDNRLRISEEARRWFFKHGRQPFSFEWICEQLDWSADAIRKQIRKEEVRFLGDEENKTCGEYQGVFLL
jgi:hypothetical protein